MLADEINRASPEDAVRPARGHGGGQVTIDGVTRPSGAPFLVLATQNPIEQAGTYRLPEAQLDRFMMQVRSATRMTRRPLRILQGGRADGASSRAIVAPDTLVR